MEALASFDCQQDSQRETGDRECLSLLSLADTHLSHIKLTHPKFHKDLADLDRWTKELLYIFPRCTILLKARCEKGCMLPHM